MSALMLPLLHAPPADLRAHGRDTRAEILAYLGGHPHARRCEIARGLGLTATPVAHHLAKLLDARLVVRRGARYALQGVPPPGDPAPRPREVAVLDALSRAGPASVADLAQATGLGATTVRQGLAALRTRGRVEARKVPGTKRVAYALVPGAAG